MSPNTHAHLAPEVEVSQPDLSPVAGETTDSELVARALAGDQAAFGELYKRYRGTVHAIALTKVKGHATWDDVLALNVHLADMNGNNAADSLANEGASQHAIELTWPGITARFHARKKRAEQVQRLMLGVTKAHLKAEEIQPDSPELPPRGPEHARAGGKLWT